MRTARFVTVFSLCVFIAASVAACRNNNYELELQPDGDTMQRKVSMWTYTSQNGVEEFIDFDTGTLQHVSQIYDATMPTNLAKRHEFEGQFGRRLPADIGDGGWYLRQASTMGSTNVYVEHVDGGRKIGWDLDTRQKSLHRLVDVWLVSLDSEFGDDERYPPFREFVDVVIRDDLFNIAIYLWGYDMFGSIGANESDDDDEVLLLSEVLFRIAIYLAERDYFDPVKLPELVQRVRTAAEADQPNMIWSFMLRGVATKLGIDPDEPLPWPLTEFDEDPIVFIESVDQIVAESAEIQAMAKAWEQEYWDSLSPSEYAYQKKMDQVLSVIDPGEPAPARVDEMVDVPDVEVPPRNYVVLGGKEPMLSQLVGMAFSLDLTFGFGETTASLQIILHVSQEPLLTNGKWEADGTIRWSEGIGGDGSWGDRLPDIFYAVWAAPALEFQQERFGKVVLEGEKLAEHVEWYLALAPELIQEWDDFLMELKPGPELIAKLQNFCFSSELSECESKSAPAAPSHKTTKNGGYVMNIPLRSSIARHTIREIVRALVPEPEADNALALSKMNTTRKKERALATHDDAITTVLAVQLAATR